MTANEPHRQRSTVTTNQSQTLQWSILQKQLRYLAEWRYNTVNYTFGISSLQVSHNQQNDGKVKNTCTMFKTKYNTKGIFLVFVLTKDKEQCS